jgi:peptidoglycan/LPS O-acetylase OafA/YrhL
MSFGASLVHIGKGLVYVAATAASIGAIWGVADMGRVLGAGDEVHFMLGVCIWFIVVGAGVVMQVRRRVSTSPNSMLFLTLLLMALGTVIGVITNGATQPPIQEFKPADINNSELSF